ncbi:MAG: outer membrane beta-barrel protein [Lachnospiraceae bacterium]|nr:outer membrane beta-barrel protein [Lachnospiraceae bacterium]
MKKILGILFLSLFLPISSYAQVHLGAGYVNQSLSEHNLHLLNGFHIGGGYSISIGNRVSVTPGFYYLRSQGGLNETGNLWLTYTFATPIPVKDEKEYFRNNSLLLPIDVSFSIIKSPVFRLFITGGPSISYELNTSYDYSCSDWEGSCKDLLSGSETINPKIDYSRWCIGIGGGVGVDIYKHYRITAGYEYGLNNRLGGREYHTLQDDKSMHTQRIHLGVAYVF